MLASVGAGRRLWVGCGCRFLLRSSRRVGLRKTSVKASASKKEARRGFGEGASPSPTSADGEEREGEEKKSENQKENEASIPVCASRDEVAAAVTKTTVALTAIAAATNAAANATGVPWLAQGTRATELLNWAGADTSAAIALGGAIGTAAAVTAARLALYNAWTPFREATDSSNAVALTNIADADILWVAGAPAVSEELLFRGDLLPLMSVNSSVAIGCVLSSVLFGVLHVPGSGRNAAFAAWASAVGGSYALLYLTTGALYAPAIAHGVSNAAAAYWWRKNRNL